MRRLVALGLACGLLLAACGDDDDDDAGGDSGAAASGEEGEYVDAIATAILEDEDEDAASEPNPLAGNEEVARCAAAGFVEVLGVDGLEDLGLTLELIQSGEDDLLDDVEFSEEQSEDLAATLVDCVPTEIWAAAFAGAGDEETVDCLVEGFVEAGLFEETLAQSLQGNEDFEPTGDDTSAVLEECGLLG